MKCKDPAWMKSSTNGWSNPFSNEETFYPAGTECYRDPSQGSCFLFGNSGSGLVRKFNKSSPSQHAFTGPLSMSKSCDQIWIYNGSQAIQYSSENPGVFTDAYCYLPWIAAMYGMKLPENYTTKESCGKEIGNKSNINLEDCMGQDVTLSFEECKVNKTCEDVTLSFEECKKECEDRERSTGLLTTGYGGTEYGAPFKSGRRFRKCDFTFKMKDKDGTVSVFDECRLLSEEGYAYNIYTCMVSCCFSFSLDFHFQDSYGNKLACANNCKGVDPNSVIIGGGAVLGEIMMTPLKNFDLFQQLQRLSVVLVILLQPWG